MIGNPIWSGQRAIDNFGQALPADTNPYIRVANVSEGDNMRITIIAMGMIVVVGLGALAVAWYLTSLAIA